MKLEKINENKLKVILSISDLANQNIDLHSFMSNTLQYHDLFKYILTIAKQETGFISKNDNLKIEILSISNTEFVLTFTKLLHHFKPTLLKKDSQRTLIKNSIFIYEFETFDDFCMFSSSLKSQTDTKNSMLFFYNFHYYLVLNNFNVQHQNSKKICCLLTDFSTYVHNSAFFYAKLCEYGKIIFKNNAINSSAKYFN